MTSHTKESKGAPCINIEIMRVFFIYCPWHWSFIQPDFTGSLKIPAVHSYILAYILLFHQILHKCGYPSSKIDCDIFKFFLQLQREAIICWGSASWYKNVSCLWVMHIHKHKNTLPEVLLDMYFYSYFINKKTKYLTMLSNYSGSHNSWY